MLLDRLGGVDLKKQSSAAAGSADSMSVSDASTQPPADESTVDVGLHSSTAEPHLSNLYVATATKALQCMNVEWQQPAGDRNYDTVHECGMATARRRSQL